MRVLGLACGSPGGNSELLLKAALMAVNDQNHDVELVQVAPLVLPGARPGTLPPHVPDDRPWLVEKLIDADALIIAAPVYTRSPSAPLKLLVDRAFGPRVDVAAVMRAREGKQNGDPRHAHTIVDERVLKPRVAGFISVGGATSAEWLTFGLPLMHLATFSMHIAVVDQMQVLGAAMPGTVLLNREAIERAEQLGRNVAAEIGKSFDEAFYHGEAGVCPLCHCDLIIPGIDQTECATCCARGVLTDDDGRMRLEVDEAGRDRSILTMTQKFYHQDEIDAVGARLMPMLAQIPALRERFDSFDCLSKPETPQAMSDTAQASEAPVPYHLKPIDGPPPADVVAGADNSIMAGLKLEYRYTSGREYRLTFTEQEVKFEMLDAPVYKPEYAIPVSLPYYARKIRDNQVLVHWMVPNRVGHVTLIIDYAQRKIYVSALMPFKMEFFDEADIFLVEQRPA